MDGLLNSADFRKLGQLLSSCETIMEDAYLRQHTNVICIYHLVMGRIIFETDPYLDTEIYTIPLIRKPA